MVEKEEIQEALFRKAKIEEVSEIWKILQEAIEKRRLEGSKQWQNGYPNSEVVKEDIRKEVGYVLVEDSVIQAYAAVILNEEPAYLNIDGKWLTNGDFLVIHRVAASKRAVGKGKAYQLLIKVEDLARQMKIPSIRMDTNFDNLSMLGLLKKLDYLYCGEVLMRGEPRKAFEKKIL